MLPTVTSHDFQEAMDKFDLEMRAKYWRNWEKHSTTGRAIYSNTKYYPLRHITSLISRKFDTTPIEKLQDLARQAGLSVVQIAPTHSAATKKSQALKQRTTKQVLFGNYKSEDEFETAVIVPLIQEIGLPFKKQVTCTFYTGSKPYHGRIDLVVYRNQQAIAVIECKKSIQGPMELSAGIAQAKSYALMSGISKFILAAPQGLWCFQLERNQEKSMMKLTANNKKLLANKVAGFLSEHQ